MIILAMQNHRSSLVLSSNKNGGEVDHRLTSVFHYLIGLNWLLAKQYILFLSD